MSWYIYNLSNEEKCKEKSEIEKDKVWTNVWLSLDTQQNTDWTHIGQR